MPGFGDGTAGLRLGLVLVALTRRTRGFGELAEAVESQLANRGLVVGGDVVDQILRNRIAAVAELMRVTPRTALGYAPEDLPKILSDTIYEAVPAPPEPPPPRPLLRVVADRIEGHTGNPPN